MEEEGEDAEGEGDMQMPGPGFLAVHPPEVFLNPKP